MKQCRECGTLSPDDTVFCYICGTKFPENDAEEKNEAAYRWKLRGMCMWSLGQEDLRLWEWLPKQV